MLDRTFSDEHAKSFIAKDQMISKKNTGLLAKNHVEERSHQENRDNKRFLTTVDANARHVMSDKGVDRSNEFFRSSTLHNSSLSPFSNA